jgi:hypothetical protein
VAVVLVLVVVLVALIVVVAAAALVIATAGAADAAGVAGAASRAADAGSRVAAPGVLEPRINLPDDDDPVPAATAAAAAAVVGPGCWRTVAGEIGWNGAPLAREMVRRSPETTPCSANGSATAAKVAPGPGSA